MKQLDLLTVPKESKYFPDQPKVPGIKIALLYVITRIETGQSYVGVTFNARKRWAHHRWLAKSGRSKQLIHKALKKYGAEAFQFEVIACSADWSSGALAERDLIAQYKSYVADGGYNLTIGGEGPAGRKCSAETRERISAANSGRPGRKITDEEKAASKIRMTALRTADPESFLTWSRKGGSQTGRVNGPETIAKMKAAALKVWADRRAEIENSLRVEQHH